MSPSNSTCAFWSERDHHPAAVCVIVTPLYQTTAHQAVEQSYNAMVFEIEPLGELADRDSRTDALRWLGDEDSHARLLREQVAGQAAAVPPAASRSRGNSLVVRNDDELAGHLADRMTATDHGRVPILSRKTGELVGLVARRDLLRVRANTMRERDSYVYCPGGHRNRECRSLPEAPFPAIAHGATERNTASLFRAPILLALHPTRATPLRGA